MQVDLIPQPELIDESKLSGRTAIVIDLLRASSTMVTALANGAALIIPTATPLEAEQKCQAYENSITAGERQGIKIKGFNLGNSPLEFTRNRVSSRNVVHCTSNGTRTILKCSDAANLLVGSLLNRAACLNYAISLNRDIVLVCAGRKGGPAQEDSICAGAFVEHLRNQHYTLTFSKTALEAFYFYKLISGNIHKTISKSPSGQNLISLGLKRDIDLCLRRDVFDVVPVFKDGIIK